MSPSIKAPAPPPQAVEAVADSASFTGRFRRDLADSDALHWGEGTVHVGADRIAFEGRLAPEPDYRLYLSPEFFETAAAFEALKPQMVELGPVRSFDGFVLPVPDGVRPEDYVAAIVWCESLGQFITAAAYR